MGSILTRKGSPFLYLQFVGADGRKQQRATEYRHDERDKAQALLDRTEALIAAGVKHADPLTGKVTLRHYAESTWLPRREKLGIASWKDGRGHLRNHVLQKLGGLELRHVRAWHLRDLFDDLRTSGELEQKTIWNIYATVKALFRDAQVADLIQQSPCILTEHELGPMIERDRMERAAAVYTRGEIRMLISDPRIPQDRRALYALEFFARMRKGESFAVRWRHLGAAKPLDMITVARSHKRDRTKTGMIRYVPVHPTLAAILAEWRLAWSSIYGRQPGIEDLLVPVIATKGKGRRLTTGAQRTSGSERAPFARDLRTLEIPHRRRHDLGSAMITLSEEDGTDPDRLEEVTHTSGRGKRGAFSGYLRRQWPTLCAEVAKLDMRRELPEVVALGAGCNRAAMPADPEHPRGVTGWRRRESNPGPQHAGAPNSIRDGVFPMGWDASDARERLRSLADCSNAAKRRGGPGGRERPLAVAVRASRRGGA